MIIIKKIEREKDFIENINILGGSFIDVCRVYIMCHIFITCLIKYMRIKKIYTVEFFLFFFIHALEFGLFMCVYVTVCMFVHINLKVCETHSKTVSNI